MSLYPSDQRCPRCQYPVTPGATTCANCGLALTSAQQPSSNPYGAPPVDPYGQPSTNYGSQGTINSAPTMQTPLYPQSSGGWGNGQQGAYSPPSAGYTSTQMQPGYNPTPAYPGSQPQGGFGTPPPTYPGSTPAYPGSTQPQSGFPGGFPTSGPPTPLTTPPQQKSRGPMIAIISVIVLVVLVGGGVAGYLLTRPKPTLSIKSNYSVGATPAGAAGTTLTITGDKFSGSSSITFFLDGQAAPGAQTYQSDNSGAVNASLTVTADWPVGAHTLTAKDGSGYVTQTGAQVQIVKPGEANTPGPNGSPSNSVSFSVAVVITSKDFGTIKETLIITGKGDSGGTVCQARDDGNTQYSYSSTLNFSDGTSLPYTETTTNSCSGTYAGGHLTYTETTVTDVWNFSGTTCDGNSHKMQILVGDFSDGKTVSGTYNEDQISLNCTYKNQPITVSPDSGTFTATVNQ